MQPRFLDRRSPPHTLTLVMMAATGTLAMNIFLPSLPGMARYFQTEYAIVQLAVSLYLAATAVVQLAIGPLSDRYGRRPVLLVCLVIFLASTIAAIYSPTIEVLLVCRVFQAAAAAGMVLARAIVRDTVNHVDDAASRIGYVTMGMSLVPMIGPIIGGFLDEAYGWKSTFLLVFAFGLATAILAWFDLGETNRHQSTSLSAQIRTYPELLGSRRFWGYSMTAMLASGAFFAFVGGGPYVASEMLGLSPSLYAIYFGILSFGYLAGNFISGRFSRRAGINRMMLTGNILATCGVGTAVTLVHMGFMHPAAVFGPIIFVGMGNGMTLPNANAGQVSVRPHLAGSASGLGGTMQLGGGAILAFIAGALISETSGPFPLLYVMFASSFGAVFSTLYVIYVARQVARDGGDPR